MGDSAHLANPAGRLFELVKATTAEAPRVKDSRQLRGFVADYLGFDAADNATYFAAVAEIVALPVEVRKLVAAIEHPVPSASILLRPVEDLEPVLPDLGTSGASLRGFVSRIPTHTVHGLEVTSEVLAHHVKAATPTDESLSEIRDLATHIVDVLAEDARLSPQFRESIRLHAQSIIDGVNRYKINGAQTLIDEADALIGSYVRHVDEASRERKHPAILTLRKLVSSITIATSLVSAPGAIAATVDVFAALAAPPAVVETPAEAPSDTA